MIRYDLICHNDHEFKAWFSGSADYDAQRKKRLIACPICGSVKIDKAIMAPNVSTARKKEARAEKQAQKTTHLMNEMAAKIRDEITSQCDDVGEKFADEARAMHYGEKDKRGIYGQASLKEAAELNEEGIAAIPLPGAIAPKAKDKLN